MSTAVLEGLEEAVAAAAERVGPAVVGLGRGWGRGSGVVIADGRVLTNAHVLRGDEVAVRRADGEVALGQVAGADADLDVAVIAVDTGDTAPVAWDPAVARLLRRATGRRRGAAARHQLRPHGRRPAARAPGRRRAARAGRGARPR